MNSRLAIFFSTALIAAASLSACAPNDEKVRSGGGFNGTSGGDSGGGFSDQVKEYSRSMLIELADVARQTESVLQVVTPAPVAAKEQPAAPGAAPADAPAALLTTACKVVQTLPSPADTVKFQTDIKGCKEKGATFEGTQYGRELAFAALAKDTGFASVIRVEGKGLETTLVPVKNTKDSLRVKTSRFLEAELLSATETVRVYRFAFESHSSYSLDLKSSVDNGQIVSKAQGVLEFDLATRKITSFKTTDAGEKLELKVTSARQSKNGGKITRQEFFGSGRASELAIDLDGCSLPVGTMKSRFTVGPIGAKKYDIDSTLDLVSSKDSIVDAAKVGMPKAKMSAKLCSADGQITMTEFYAGLIY